MIPWKQKPKKMLKFRNKLHFILFLIAISILFSACNNRPSDVIAESKMTNILTEMHKLDGSFSEKGLQYGHYPEKKKYYQFILEKYDITEAEFDSSVVWYSKNPKKFEKIYTNVLLAIDEFEATVKTGVFHPEDSIQKANSTLEIWNKKTQYRFTKDSTRTKLYFVINNDNFMLGDVYELKFLHRIAPIDSCTDAHIELRLNYFNQKSDLVYIKTHNDSLLRRYTIHIPATKKSKIKSISGVLLGSTSFKGKFKASLDSISLMRKFNYFKQDSLRAVVLKEDSIFNAKSTKTATKITNKKELKILK